MMASGNSKTQEGEQGNEKDGNEINKVARTVQYDQQQAQKQHRQTSNQIWLHRVWKSSSPHKVVLALLEVSTGSGVERAVISPECIPAESPTILVCK